MRLEPEQKLLATFSYTSLTDVVMLLLIFFLLSSSFISDPTISVQLPNAESSDPKTEQTIAITLTEKGAVYLNDAPVRLADLGKTLAQRLKESPDRAVQIRADKTVTLERAVQIVDIAKAAGATRFLIATEPPGPRR